MTESKNIGPTPDPDVPGRVANELGRTGLKQYSGLLYEEYLPQLQGRRAFQVYREMQDNPVVGAVLYAVETTLRSVTWNVEPASDDEDNIEAAEFVESCMNDMEHTWEDFISEILTMLPYGWSYFEIVYKKRQGRRTEGGRRRKYMSRYDDNKIGWRKFAPRSQETLFRWEIDKYGTIKGMHQWPQPTGGSQLLAATPREDEWGGKLIFLPMEKCLLFRTTSRRNSPEGRSMLRSAYRPWYFQKRVEEIEAIGIERDLAGMPVAHVPIELLDLNRTAEQTATFNYIKDVVTRTKRDEQEGIIWPRAYDENGNDLYGFELMSTGGRRSFDTGAIIQRYAQQIAMTVLADFILLGHEAVGSFALSSDKTELFAVALGSMLDSIEDTLNDHAVPKLLELNGYPTDESQPMFRHGDIEKPDLQELIQYIQGLTTAGAPLFPDIVLENYLREVASLPIITEEERERIEEEKMLKQQEQMEMMGGQMGPPGMGMGPGQGGNQPTPFGRNEPGRPKEPDNEGPSKNEVATSGGPGRPKALSSGSSVRKALSDVLAEVGRGVEV